MLALAAKQGLSQPERDALVGLAGEISVTNPAEGAEMPTQGRSLPHPGQGRLETGPVRIPR
jgi:hypothetical protein